MVTPSIALLYASTVLLVLLSAYAHHKADVPGARPFQLLLLCIAVWSVGYAVALGTFERGPRLFWRNVQWFGIAFVPSAWVVFALEYTGREAWVTRRSILALSVVPVATVAVSWLAPELMWQNSQIDPTAGMAIVTRRFGPWYWVNLASAYVAFVAGTVFVLGLVLTRSSLYLDQAISLLVGSAIAWVGNVVSNFRLGPIPMDYTPFAFPSRPSCSGTRSFATGCWTRSPPRSGSVGRPPSRSSTRASSSSTPTVVSSTPTRSRRSRSASTGRRSSVSPSMPWHRRPSPTSRIPG